MSDAASPMFYAADLPAEGETVILDEAEARHATAARRLGEGDAICLTDGRGMLATCRLTTVSVRPRRVACRVEQLVRQNRSPVERVLAGAIPKGERQGIMIDMATQLGMDVFVPLQTDFASVRYQPKMAPRWEKIMMSACKQSRRCHFPTVAPAQRVEEIVSNSRDGDLLVVGDAGGSSLLTRDQGIMIGVRRLVALVGPEAGFSEAEQRILRHDRVVTVSLGSHILRTEAAAVALLAALNQITG